jgi:predicted AAA+ superfamily ATPase
MSVFDTGVQQCLLGADIAKMSLVADWDVVNKGTLAEVYVAAELVKAASYYERQQLYCWHREKKDSQAEVDFVVQVGQKIVPVEVKSGAIGKMKSLRIFMDEKHSTYGVRTSMENFAHYENIRVYPLYAISNLLNAEL